MAWIGDLTEIPNDEGPFYLAAITDLHSRRIVGFALGPHHDPALAKAALCMAIAVRGVGSVGCSRSSCPMVNTVASPQSRRATCHAVAAGTTALITQLPLPFDRS